MSAVASAAARNRQTAGGLIKAGVAKPLDELGSQAFLKASSRVPDKSHQLDKAMIGMCCAEDRWLTRCMIVTARAIHITDEDQRRTILDIPLVDIKDITKVHASVATYENRKNMQGGGMQRLEGKGGGQLRKFSGSSLGSESGHTNQAPPEEVEHESNDYYFQIRTYVPSGNDTIAHSNPDPSGDNSPLPRLYPDNLIGADGRKSQQSINQMSKRNSYSDIAISEEGRVFFFKYVSGLRDRTVPAGEFIDHLRHTVTERKAKDASSEQIWMFRYRVSEIYFSWQMQGVVAVFIFANFVVNAVQAQLTPEDGTVSALLFNDLDFAFTILFTAELSVNLFVNWLTPFIMDSWNIFDTIVVVTSLLALGLQGLPGVSILRIVRAFRVLRLFGRLGSLRRIINALTSSWLPVLNAFAVVMFITAIYAILGVEFFSKASPIHFGSFSNAFYTMFTVTTMEGWVDLMSTDLFDAPDQIDSGAVIFMVSFIVIVVWTMLPVVVAILLDNFTMAASREESKEEEKIKSQKTAEIHHSLDPIMSKLMMHSSPEDLKFRVHTFFSALNVDEAESISYEAIHDGLLRIREDLSAPIHLSREEFDKLTKYGRWCDEEGQLDERQFERVILWELMDYSDRVAANSFANELESGSPGVAAVLSSLKMQNLASFRYIEEGIELTSRKFSPQGSPRGKSYQGTPKAIDPKITQLQMEAPALKVEVDGTLTKKNINPIPVPSPMQGQNGHKNPENGHGNAALQDHFTNLAKAQEEMQVTVKSLQIQLEKVQKEQQQQQCELLLHGKEAGCSELSRAALYPSCGFCVDGMGTQHCWTCGIVMCWDCRVDHKQVFETQHHVVHSLKEQISARLSEPLGAGAKSSNRPGVGLFGRKLPLKPLKPLTHKKH